MMYCHQRYNARWGKQSKVSEYGFTALTRMGSHFICGESNASLRRRDHTLSPLGLLAYPQAEDWSSIPILDTICEAVACVIPP